MEGRVLTRERTVRAMERVRQTAAQHWLTTQHGRLSPHFFPFCDEDHPSNAPRKKAWRGSHFLGKRKALPTRDNAVLT